MNNCVSFSDTGMAVLGYMLAIYTALKVTALRFHFFKMARIQDGGLKMAAANV